MKQSNIVSLAITGLLLAFVLVILALVTPAGASSTGRENGCHTFNVFAHQSREDNAIDANFCGLSREIETVEVSESDTPPTEVVNPTSEPTLSPTDVPTQEPTVAPTEKPTKTPKPTEVVVVEEPTKKPKCNKGEGNGGEGCDPGNNPDNGNDDEN